MIPRFNIFKRKSASQKKAQTTQQSVNHFYEVYQIPVGTPLTQVKAMVERLPDPTKKRIALGRFDELIRELNRNRNQ